MKNQFLLTVLGAGTMVPTKQRNPAGFLLEADNKKILLDSGPGIMRHLIDFGFNLRDIDYIFLSHFHTDHFGDAFNFIHTRWVDDLYQKKEHKKLTFLCPLGTEKRFKLWRKIYWVEPKESYPVVFLEGVRKIKLGKVAIELFSVPHVPWFQSLGIRVQFAGKKLVYTGDLRSVPFPANPLKQITQADLLIIEASCKEPAPSHYTLEQIKPLALKGKVKKVMVVHVPPPQEEMVRKFCQKQRKFIFGKDGLKLKI